MRNVLERAGGLGSAQVDLQNTIRQPGKRSGVGGYVKAASLTGPEMSDLSIFPAAFLLFFVGVAFSFLSSFTFAAYQYGLPGWSVNPAYTHWHTSTGSRPSCRNHVPLLRMRTQRPRSRSTISLPSTVSASRFGSTYVRLPGVEERLFLVVFDLIRQLVLPYYTAEGLP